MELGGGSVLPATETGPLHAGDIEQRATKGCPCARHCQTVCYESTWKGMLLLLMHPGFDFFLMGTSRYWWTDSQAAELISKL